MAGCLVHWIWPIEIGQPEGILRLLFRYDVFVLHVTGLLGPHHEYVDMSALERIWRLPRVTSALDCAGVYGFLGDLELYSASARSQDTIQWPRAPVDISLPLASGTRRDQ